MSWSGNGIKNPLRKRYLRDLKGNLGKYLAVFALLVIVIGEVCGYLVADESLRSAYAESFAKYNIEDGNFTVQKALNRSQVEAIEAKGVRLNELFFVDADLQDGGTLRVFRNRHDMDRACVMDGRLAEVPGEIAVDRMFADSNGLSIGDSLSDGARTWTITGKVALSDYSALFENNNDSMFNGLDFGVSVVSEQEFQTLPEDALVFRYAWQYDQEPTDRGEEKALSDAFLAELSNIVHLDSYLPRFQNQAICYAGEDMNNVKALMMLFFYLCIAIIAFVFGVTTSSTIAKEANAIGTLRASGFTRLELLRHYLAVPLLVTMAAVLIGNILGFTVLKGVNAAIYYNNYSLPSYTTLWDPGTVATTTIIPPLLMLAIDGLILWRRLSLKPLRFLRGELRREKRGALRLNERIRFFSRFRIRVILQNIPDYIVLFVGVFFAEILLLFGLVIPDDLEHYQDTLPDEMISEDQYILTVPQGALEGDSQLETLMRRYSFSKAVETENPNAEKFMAYSLRTPENGDYKGEPVLLYGIDQNSRYVHLSPEPGEVYASSAYADKFKLKVGDEVTLLEEYGDGEYTFPIQGIYDYEGALALFMPRDDENALFGYDKDMYAGYFSDSQITDIPELYIGRVIDYDALTKISRQLTSSMGGVMKIIIVFAVLVFFILMYVLSKIIIEKNTRSISMAMILGYYNREIDRLYINSTTVALAICLVVALPAATAAFQWLFEVCYLSRISGWIPFYVGPWIYPTIIIMGLAVYLVVSLFEMKQIRRIPMGEALKNVD